MHTAIQADTVLRTLALSTARNNVGAMLPAWEIYVGAGLTQAEYEQINRNPQFLRYVDSYTAELKESGFSFAAKSRVLAEDLLPTAYNMAKDSDVPAGVRQKIIENLVEWGDLKPKNTLGVGGGPGFSITINLPGTPQNGAKTLVLEGIQPHEALESGQNDDDTPAEHDFTPHTPITPLRPRRLTFSEPADYVYAGDDIL